MTDRETAWRDALSAHSSSGMPLSRYCRDKGLNYHQAVYWRRRLATIDAAAGLSVPDAPAPTFSLVELSEPPRQVADSGVAIECARCRISLKAGFDPSVLSRALAVLSGLEAD